MSTQPTVVEWHTRGKHVAVHRTELVGPDTPVTTIGGCSALELAEGLQEAGRNARVHPTGYFHTPVTICQELRRVFGRSLTRPRERSWTVGDGVVDPDKDYRGRVFPDEAAMVTWTGDFDARADALFRESKVVVVTLGNAEAWVDRATGHHLAEIPPPGVYDGQAHELRALTVTQIKESLTEIYDIVTDLLIGHLVLAVTAVPLSEAYLDPDPQVATLTVKSRLRAAVAEFIDEHPDVAYFPVFEIVFGAERPSDFMLEDGRHQSRLARSYLVWRFLEQFGTAAARLPQPLTDWLSPPTKTASDYRREGPRRKPESWLSWPHPRIAAAAVTRPSTTQE